MQITEIKQLFYQDFEKAVQENLNLNFGFDFKFDSAEYTDDITYVGVIPLVHEHQLAVHKRELSKFMENPEYNIDPLFLFQALYELKIIPEGTYQIEL